MTVDPRLVRAEAAMRHGFACAQDRDGDAMVAAFKDLTEEESAIAINLARLIINETLKDASPDGMTDTDFRELSANIARTETWADLDAATVETYLRELNSGATPSTDSPDTVALSIVCGGYLVGVVRAEGQAWTDYLDDLLDRVVPQD